MVEQKEKWRPPNSTEQRKLDVRYDPAAVCPHVKRYWMRNMEIFLELEVLQK